MIRLEKYARCGHLGFALHAAGWCLVGTLACDTSTPSCSAPGTICTAIGTGSAGAGASGSPATSAELYLPIDVTATADAMYIADFNNHRVIRLRDGRITTVLGSGFIGDFAPGPGTEVLLKHPTHILELANGDLGVSGWHSALVVRYDARTELASVLAGTGEAGYDPDGAPATETRFELPVATALDRAGRVVVMDQGNLVIRRIGSDDLVETIAGTGQPGYAGDGGPATLASLNLPRDQSGAPAGLMTAHDGTLYFADTLNHVVRAVDAGGTIATIAGTAAPGKSTSGFALTSQLNGPTDVAVDDEGAVFIADHGNHCIRKVTGDAMTTVAGRCGERGYDGDGGPADAALLDRPYGITIDRDGRLWIADTHNHVVRVVAPP